MVSDEDIGRHNALDKVLGFAIRKKLDLHQHYAILSSRCSVELVQKAVRAGLSTLVHLSSPSNLAVEMAKHYQLNLIQITRSNEIIVHALSSSERLSHENR
jgi:FdhD protein